MAPSGGAPLGAGGGDVGGGPSTGGAAIGGAIVGIGGDGSGGAGLGGNPDGLGGTLVGGNGAGGGVSGGSDSGSGGTASGGGSAGFSCPPGSEALVPTLGTATLLAAPPEIPTTIEGSTFFLEGPVVLNGKVYFSQFRDYSNPDTSPGRIMALDLATTTYAEVAPDTGTNGMALLGPGVLLAASQKVGGIVKVDLSTTPATLTTLIAEYMGARLNSPNDITVGADGTVYFTDPDWNCTAPCYQTVNRVYRFKLEGTPTLTEIPTVHTKPNGVTLSPNGTTLYVSGDGTLVSMPVLPDGSVGSATAFGSVISGDGMAVDCAGNLYVATNGDISVLSPAGVALGSIVVGGDATNIAFGGPGNTNVYITTLREGMFTLDVGVPGFPF